MLAERNELALQIAVLAYLHPEQTVSEIAASLGWAPLFIINALEEGVAMELYSYDREADTIKLCMDHPLAGRETIHEMGSELERLTDEILYAVAVANKQEQDISLDQLKWSWLKAVPYSHVEIAIEVLLSSGMVHSYEMSDPYDKESKYTFLSLSSNEEHHWGHKQFKPRSKESKKRMKKERGSK